MSKTLFEAMLLACGIAAALAGCDRRDAAGDRLPVGASGAQLPASASR